MNFASIGMNIVQEDLNKTRVIASIGCLFLWLQIFYWFRLFDRTASFVDLILETLWDIRWFLPVLLSLMMMFMTSFYMIQVNRLTFASSESPVYSSSENSQSIFGAGLLN